MKKTFVILCSEYPPFMGGISLWAENLLDTLSANGYEAVVMTHMTRSNKKKGSLLLKTGALHQRTRLAEASLALPLPGLLRYMLTRKELVLVAATWNDIEVIHRLKGIFRFKIFCASHGTDITKHVYPRKPKLIAKINQVYSSVDLFMPVSSSLDTIARDMYPKLTCPTLVLGCNVKTDMFIPEHDTGKQLALRQLLGIGIAPTAPSL